MEQFEQLLTCAICLDRYRNPKLLPCQHSFCMEPCMEGLIDLVRRQVKCPECRAEHRIPYQGVQGFPTNVTLQRFLELHIEITGELPDPTSGLIMKRCAVCSEKAYCTMCFHCDKEVCPECKAAHKDILRREITRITNQIRRALHRLEDMLAYVEKSMLLLQQNSTSVSEEVEEIYNRLNKALKDRSEYLRNEISRYLTTEHKHLAGLKDNLEMEIANIQSNCDLADKYMQNENVDWDDCELMDTKEIFLKTIEFLRYFEAETGDYTRRAKFIMQHDPTQLVKHVANFGDLSINMPHPATLSGSNALSSGNMLQPPGPGLMRSKSDHRLASQFRQQEEHGYDGGENCGRVSPLGGRKFGERLPTRSATSDRLDSRYGRNDRDIGGDGDSGYDNEGRGSARSRFRARLAARHANENADSDTDVQIGRSVRFADMHTQPTRERERDRVLDTEDVTKGPLSGITRLYDSPRVMKRLKESETKKTKQEVPTPPVQQAPKFQPQPPTQPQRRTNITPVQRQVSEDDEIAKIKKQNKSATTSSDNTSSENQRAPASERVTSLRREGSREDRQLSSPNRASVGSDRNWKTPVQETISSNEDSNDDDDKNGDGISSLQTHQKRSSKTPVGAASRRSSSTDANQSGGIVKKSARSASSDSSASNESSKSSLPVRNTGAAFTTDELRQQFLSRMNRDSNNNVSENRNSSSRTRPSAIEETQKELAVAASRAQNRPLASANRSTSASVPLSEKAKAENILQNDDDDDDDDETTTSSESESTDSDVEHNKSDISNKAALEKTDIGPLLARSAHARDSGSSSTTGSNMYRRRNRDDASSSTTRFNSNPEPYRPAYASPKEASSSSRSSKYSNRTDEPEPKARFTSRFLNKNKSTGMAAGDEDEFVPSSGRRYSGNDDSLYSSRREPAYTPYKDRKLRLARSKSTHGFGEEADADLEDSTPSSYYPASYLASKASNAGSDLSRSRSSHVLKSRENSPDRPMSANTGQEKDGSSLSSWARYLKNKYGNRTKDVKENNLPTLPGTSGASPTSRRLSLGLPLRPNNSTSVESSDDDQKNLEGSPNSPIAATAVQSGFVEVGTTLRNQYMQKRSLSFKIGSRGSGPGYFTWPRGIAVGPDNSVVVADSSNHRVQVFDQYGKFIKEFGTFGSGEGEFDCLAGVAVNRIGQYIIADRYNHRVQVLDPSGRFLRAFGSQGSADGKFNYPWGITTDALGFVYVCDKENHRIQVFQSDGTFVGKFGSLGSKDGQLEHPHYIAVSNTNRVVVSDSNNHRVQIFDVNGRVINSIGSEGSANGQFKFPRGVAVDDQGYVLVGDSGNNRIQIFHPDGTFLKSFGCWGSGDGEFKGLEGVAVMSNGKILVCDRENHRVQVF